MKVDEEWDVTCPILEFSPLIFEVYTICEQGLEAR